MERLELQIEDFTKGLRKEVIVLIRSEVSLGFCEVISARRM